MAALIPPRFSRDSVFYCTDCTWVSPSLLTHTASQVKTLTHEHAHRSGHFFFETTKPKHATARLKVTS